jgi:hypothetical protein
MARTFSWLVAFFLVIGAGVAQGLRTDRWSLSSEPAASAAKLDGLPLTLGDWDATDEKMEATEKDLAEIADYKLRTYTNKVTHKSVKILIMCGRPGPIAVHTPDVCFGGAGYKVIGERRQTVKLPGDLPQAEFMTARFVRTGGAEEQRLRILWAWSTDGAWSAPDDPRWKFARSPALFKLYVMCDPGGSDEVQDTDPSLSLLRLLLADLYTRLAPAS